LKYSSIFVGSNVLYIIIFLSFQKYLHYDLFYNLVNLSFTFLTFTFVLPIAFGFQVFKIKYRRNHFFENYLLAICYILEDKTDFSVEKQYLKSYFSKTFGNKICEFSINFIIENLKNNKYIIFSTYKIFLETQDKIQLLNRLIQIAASDNNFDATERKRISEISEKLKIPQQTLNKLISKYVPEEISENDFFRYFNFDVPVDTSHTNISLAYEILGISENSTFDNVKIAYRKMVKKYHPDKVLDKNPEIQQQTEEMFLKIQNAFEIIENELCNQL
jgi:DnaJ like chaperone protein